MLIDAESFNIHVAFFHLTEGGRGLKANYARTNGSLSIMATLPTHLALYADSQ